VNDAEEKFKISRDSSQTIAFCRKEKQKEKFHIKSVNSFPRFFLPFSSVIIDEMFVYMFITCSVYMLVDSRQPDNRRYPSAQGWIPKAHGPR
jgi:hypothetical protein